MCPAVGIIVIIIRIILVVIVIIITAIIVIIVKTVMIGITAILVTIGGRLSRISRQRVFSSIGRLVFSVGIACLMATAPLK